MSFDRQNPTHLSQLKSEVNTDPDTLGYDTASVQSGVLDVINLPRAAYTISKPAISQAAVRAATIFDAFKNLGIDEQPWLTWITGSNGGSEGESESLIVTADLRLQLTDSEGDGTNSIWHATNRTVMNAAMLDLIDVDGSRAQDLWGFDTFITLADWIAARDS
jgi:hypothetical protein